MTHAANAIQKNTTDTIVSHCQPVSTAVAYVADEYIPSGNTAGHEIPTRRRSAKAVIHGRDRHDAGRHDRRERIRFHALSSTTRCRMPV